MLGEASFRTLELLNMAFGTVISDQVVQHGADELVWLMARYVSFDALEQASLF